MKKTLEIIFAITIIVSCTASKKFNAVGTNEEVVQQAVSVLKKHPNNGEAKKQLKLNYEEAVKLHEDKIRLIKLRADSNYLEQVLPELVAIQDLNNKIDEVGPVVKDIISPVNYTSEIISIRQTIAGESYDRAISYLNKGGWENSKTSYGLFAKANDYVSNYKDSKKFIKEIFDKNIINVVINPEGVFFQKEPSTTEPRFSFTDIQKKLVKELGEDSYKFDTRVPARFYTDAEVKKKDIKPDWVISIRMKSIEFSYSKGFSFSDERFKSEGDRSPESYATGKTASATLTTNQLINSLTAVVEYGILDVKANKIIGEGELPTSYEWQNQDVKYSGNYKALDRQDWESINESKKNDNSTLRIEKVYGELFKNVYPNLRQVILYFVKW
jgi:hypothetical protein